MKYPVQRKKCCPEDGRGGDSISGKEQDTGRASADGGG